MKLIKDTQTQWEALPIVINRDLQKRDMLETIDEIQSLQVKQNEQIVQNSETDETSEEQIAFRDVDHQELWEEIRDMKQEWSSFEKKEFPMIEVGSSVVETCEQEHIESSEGDIKGEMVSISKTLATLPSYLGHQEFNSGIIHLPVTNGDKNSRTLDSVAQGIMQQTFNVPVTLEEIKDCKPSLWEKLLENWGVRKQLPRRHYHPKSYVK